MPYVSKGSLFKHPRLCILLFYRFINTVQRSAGVAEIPQAYCPEQGASIVGGRRDGTNPCYTAPRLALRAAAHPDGARRSTFKDSETNYTQQSMNNGPSKHHRCWMDFEKRITGEQRRHTQNTHYQD